MLSFFRKYEKTFFLIVFLPAIIGMGVTSVIVTVLTQKEASSPGVVFGEPIPRHEWELIVGPYAKLTRNESDTDNQFRFYAFTKAAERAGLRVTDGEVRDWILDNTSMNIARLKIQERMHAEGLDPQSPEYRQKFQQYFLEELANPRKNFTDEDYRKFLEIYGVTMQEFEGHQRRSLLQAKLEKTFEEAATVSPEEIWKEFREKNQRREAEVVTLDGAAYVPTAGTVPTEDEIKKYYETNRALYDEPKRVSLEYAAAPFEKLRAEVTTPPEAELEKYFQKHQADYMVWSGSVGTVKSFSDARASVLDKVQTQAAKDLAQTLMEQVKAKIDLQTKSGLGGIDMKIAIAAVDTTGHGLIVTDTTPLTEPDDFFTHPLLTGFAAQNWALKEPASATKTSDPLKGEKCVAILRTAQAIEKKVPTFADVKDQVKKDYVVGGERELAKYYKDQQWKYRTNDKWKVDYVFASYEECAKRDSRVPNPSEAEVNAFWADKHSFFWPGQDAAKVGSEAITLACKAEKAKTRVKSVLNDLKNKCEDSRQAHNRADLDLNMAAFVELSWLERTSNQEFDQKTLKEDPKLKAAAAAIQIADKEKASEPLETADGKGAVVFVFRQKIEQTVPELAVVRDQVQKDVLLTRGYDRAKEAAEKLVADLKEVKGDAVAAKLQERGLTSAKTGLFTRNTIALPNVISNQVTQVVGDTFAGEPGAGFEKWVADDIAKKVYVVRCTQREDPSDDKLTPADRAALRHDLLNKDRREFVQRKMTEVELDAKGISDKHVKWVRDRRDGPGGRISEEVRQIYVPNDKATTESWLEDAARARLDEALAKLKADANWDNVCREYSEDEATRARGGEMTVARGDLAEQYGQEFEQKLFDVTDKDVGQVSAPFKSKRGLHLIKVVKGPNAGDPHAMGHGQLHMTFRHILVKTDPKIRKLPDDVAAKAREIARKKIEDAKARIEKGEPFAKVAAEVGWADDTRARGETFTVPYLSEVMLRALEVPLTLEIGDLTKVEPFEVKVSGASEWHLLFCARDSRAEREQPMTRGEAYPQRVVFECVAASKDTVLAARQELETWTKNRPDHDPTSSELLREWKKVVPRYSTADSAKKEGAFGAVAVDPSLQGYDIAAVRALSTLDPGARSGIIEAKEGFHLVECISAKTKPADDAARNSEVAEALLRGTEWSEGN
jgi:hypothetical protein